MKALINQGMSSMKSFVIEDLPVVEILDDKAMAAIHGGHDSSAPTSSVTNTSAPPTSTTISTTPTVMTTSTNPLEPYTMNSLVLWTVTWGWYPPELKPEYKRGR